MFSPEEISYIQTQPLGRIATVSASGQSDVAPIGFKFDGKKFFIGGFDVTKTFKYKNVKNGNVRVALVIDDLASLNPWTPRGVKIHGIAEIGESHGRAVLIITPERSWSWGIHKQSFVDGKPSSRKTKHSTENA